MITDLIQRPLATTLPLTDKERDAEKESVETKQLLKDKKIVVVSCQKGGWGDYLCGAKICHYIMSCLDVPKTNIALLHEEMPTQLQAWLENEGIRLIGGAKGALKKFYKHKVESSELTPPTETKDTIPLNTDLIIYAPAHDAFQILSMLPPSKKITPLIAVREYGYTIYRYFKTLLPTAHGCCLGFQKNGIGFIPTPSLREWAKKKHITTEKERLGKLRELPTEIQKEILLEDYSEEAVDRFLKSSQLYFAYAHNTAEVEKFIDAILSMNQQIEEKRTSCFFVMGPTRWDTAIKNFEKKLKRVVKKHDAFVSIRDMNKGTTATYGYGEKNLRIITCKVAPKDACILHIASEETTLTTGDQSFSEAVSAEKFPVYEILGHKNKLYDDYLSLLHADLSEEHKTYLQIYKRPVDRDDRANRLNVNALTRLLVALKKQDAFKKQIEAAIEKVAKERDFSTQFNTILKEALS